MQTFFYVLMFVLGAVFGSFLCCQARRLRRRELRQKHLGSRSVCLHCHRQLRWYENLPLLSWLIQKGRCRHCHAGIGVAEFISELSGAATFLALATTFDPLTTAPISAARFFCALLLALFLLFLAIYDGLYGELPTFALTFSLICAIIIAMLNLWASFSNASSLASPVNVANPLPSALLNLLFATLILSGTYLVLYLVSRGRWVGDGDWLLALALALALGTPWLALLVLCLANVLATFIMLPVVLRANLAKLPTKPKSTEPTEPTKTTSPSAYLTTVHHSKPTTASSQPLHIPFGPFLVAAFFITYTFADFFQSML